MKQIISISLLFLCLLEPGMAQPSVTGRLAPKPLFRDPIHDGAADPVVIWNKHERKWFMFYTNRRANLTNSAGVEWVHGTRIGIAESADGGANWKYCGTADISLGGTNETHWAPDVIEHDGRYHMYLTFVPGVFKDWNAPRDIVHLTSTNLLNWKKESTLKLASDRVIDASVFRLPDGKWRMWYNNERDKKSIYYADSPDLFRWTDKGKAVGDRGGEGPKVFRWKDRSWMIVDNWSGLGIYYSSDLLKWTRQPKNLLQQPGTGEDDQVMGGHPDVVVSGERAFLFYFTHPGRRGEDAKKDGYEQRRSSIQVVELELNDGEVTCDRDQPTRIQLNNHSELVLRKVTFTRETNQFRWPLAELGGGFPTDWSGQGFLTLELRATSAQRFGLVIHTEAGPRKVNLQPMAGAWVRAPIPLRYFERPDQQGHDLAALGNKPRVGYFINLTGPYGNLKKVQSLGVSMDVPLNSPTLEIRSVKLEKESPGDTVLEPKPLVDEFGQWIDAEWPGKATTLAQLKAAWATEANALREGQFGWSRYGGFTNARVKATGFFRVEKTDGRWWFVDPEGYLFFSTGVNVISPFVSTPVAGREDLFARLPPADLATSPRRRGRGQEVSFHTWNLQRRYDTAWRDAWLDSTLARMDAWGFNTIGNWSDARLWDQQRKPYVVMLRGWGSGGVLGMPDVFAENFAAAVDKAAEEQCAPRKDDPWLLGYFVMNEPPWPGNELSIAAGFLDGADTAMKRELKKFLADGDTSERRREFVQGAIEKFITTVSAAMKKHDPNHLNLGLRFGSRPSEAMLLASRGFDVFSLNSYEYEANRESIEKAYRVTERPILIGEFHFGVPGRGLSAGLKQAANPEERGVAYRYYVERAAAYPAVVGTHWFQWVDEPNTGRFDGENYNIGFVDVTDRPYPELIEAAKATHQRLLEVHSGKTPPVDRKAKVQ